MYSIKISDFIFSSDLCIITVSVNLRSFVKRLLLACRFCIAVTLIWNNKFKKEAGEDITDLFNIVSIFDFNQKILWQTSRIYRVYVKCLGKFNERIPHIKTRKKVYNAICPQTLVFEIQPNNVLTQVL